MCTDCFSVWPPRIVTFSCQCGQVLKCADWRTFRSGFDSDSNRPKKTNSMLYVWRFIVDKKRNGQLLIFCLEIIAVNTWSWHGFASGNSNRLRIGCSKNSIYDYGDCASVGTQMFCCRVVSVMVWGALFHRTRMQYIYYKSNLLVFRQCDGNGLCKICLVDFNGLQAVLQMDYPIRKRFGALECLTIRKKSHQKTSTQCQQCNHSMSSTELKRSCVTVCIFCGNSLFEILLYCCCESVLAEVRKRLWSKAVVVVVEPHVWTLNICCRGSLCLWRNTHELHCALLCCQCNAHTHHIGQFVEMFLTKNQFWRGAALNQRSPKQ